MAAVGQSILYWFQYTCECEQRRIHYHFYYCYQFHFFVFSFHFSLSQPQSLALLLRDLKSPKSPNKFSYANEGQYFNLEEPPRSPKIIYSTPSPTSNVGERSAANAGNTSPASGYFEQRSPKYLPQSHQLSPSPSSSAASSSTRQFVFDAVSPRHESIGECLSLFAFVTVINVYVRILVFPKTSFDF